MLPRSIDLAKESISKLKLMGECALSRDTCLLTTLFTGLTYESKELKMKLIYTEAQACALKKSIKRSIANYNNVGCVPLIASQCLSVPLAASQCLSILVNASQSLSQPLSAPQCLLHLSRSSGQLVKLTVHFGCCADKEAIFIIEGSHACLCATAHL